MLPSPPRTLSRSRLAPFAAALLAAAPAATQDAALGTDEARIRWVGGRPMLRVTLRAGDRSYPCHLLLDLATAQPLHLHRNAAGTLRAASCDVETDGITLTDLAFTARREGWLEALTAEFAEGLQQVPVAGVLGLAAFGAHDVVVDGPGAALRLRPPTSAATDPPPPSTGVRAVPTLGSFAQGVRIRCDLGSGVSADLALSTRDPFSWLTPELCARAGHPDGVLTRAFAVAGLDFARWTPFRPLRGESGGHGGIGGAVLAQMVVTLQPAAQRVLFAPAGEPVYPEVEAAFGRAAFGRQDGEGLRDFLQAHADAPLAAEAARLLLERELAATGTPDALEFAGLALVRTAAANKKGTAALDVLDKLPRTSEHLPVRRALVEAALPQARGDEDGNAEHKLHLELGVQLRAQGDAKEARRHLLSAVFGMPVSGLANLELGHWHRDQGQLDAALGRYFLALLDARATGQQGYVAFAETFARLRGQDADLLAELMDRADGRVPSFQPIPREPGSYTKTGRTVLVELFTGAMCPPCVAADVGCDGLTQLYDPDEVVLVQWHLPVPAPEPLVAPASLARARTYGARSTPTVVIAGGEPIVGGGRADAAPDMFRRYREAVDVELKQAPVAAIAASASLAGETVELHVEVEPAPAAARTASWRVHAVLVEETVVFPGSNGVLFHHHVARGALTPSEGVPAAQATAAAPLVRTLDLQRLATELDALVAGYEQQGPFLARPVQPDPARLHVLVFVQDGGGAVLEAHTVPLAPSPPK